MLRGKLQGNVARILLGLRKRRNNFIWDDKPPNVKKVKPRSQDWLMLPELIPVSVAVKRLGVFLLPLDRMLVHRRSLPRNLLGSPTIRRYPFILLGGERHCES